MNGKVKWFDEIKGFGFIACEDGQDAFVHANQVEEGPLAEGVNVSFERDSGPKGLRASGVRLLACLLLVLGLVGLMAGCQSQAHTEWTAQASKGLDYDAATLEWYYGQDLKRIDAEEAADMAKLQAEAQTAWEASQVVRPADGEIQPSSQPVRFDKAYIAKLIQAAGVVHQVHELDRRAALDKYTIATRNVAGVRGAVEQMERLNQHGFGAQDQATLSAHVQRIESIVETWQAQQKK